jgi:hypothetical protein
MESQDNNSPINPALKQWITALVLVALLLGCLGLIVAMAGPGIDFSGQAGHLRLVSVVTQSAFCPPDDPMLSSFLFDRKHWIVCLMRVSRPAQGAGRFMRKLIDIPLW